MEPAGAGTKAVVNAPVVPATQPAFPEPADHMECIGRATRAGLITLEAAAGVENSKFMDFIRARLGIFSLNRFEHIHSTTHPAAQRTIGLVSIGLIKRHRDKVERGADFAGGRIGPGSAVSRQLFNPHIVAVNATGRVEGSELSAGQHAFDGGGGMVVQACSDGRESLTNRYRATNKVRMKFIFV